MILTESELSRLRELHHPKSADCGCSSALRCAECGTRWPCTLEQNLRNLGYPPKTISDYPQYEEPDGKVDAWQ